MKTPVKQIVEALDNVEDLDRIIEVRNILFESEALEEFESEVGDGKALYYLQEFARAHREVYGD